MKSWILHPDSQLPYSPLSLAWKPQTDQWTNRQSEKTKCIRFTHECQSQISERLMRRTCRIQPSTTWGRSPKFLPLCYSWSFTWTWRSANDKRGYEILSWELEATPGEGGFKSGRTIRTIGKFNPQITLVRTCVSGGDWWSWRSLHIALLTHWSGALWFPDAGNKCLSIHPHPGKTHVISTIPIFSQQLILIGRWLPMPLPPWATPALVKPYSLKNLETAFGLIGRWSGIHSPA